MLYKPPRQHNGTVLKATGYSNLGSGSAMYEDFGPRHVTLSADLE
jgi:hypothetical protein